MENLRVKLKFPNGTARLRGLTPNGTDFSNPTRQRGRSESDFSLCFPRLRIGLLAKVSAIGLTLPGSPQGQQ